MSVDNLIQRLESLVDEWDHIHGILKPGDTFTVKGSFIRTENLLTMEELLLANSPVAPSPDRAQPPETPSPAGESDRR